MDLEAVKRRIDAERRLRQLDSDVFQIQRRSGANVDQTIERVVSEVSSASLETILDNGVYGYDYLVDSNYVGTEGVSVTTFHGHTYSVYSTIGGAITDIEAEDTPGKLYRVGIIAGTYAEVVTFTSNQGSGVALIGLGTVEERGDFSQVYISSSMVLNATGGTTSVILENITVAGITHTAGKMSGHARQCEFRGSLDFSCLGFWFRDCEFAAASSVINGGIDDISFHDCVFSSIDLSFVGGQVNGIQVEGCDFVGGASILFDDVESAIISNNIFSTGGGLNNDFISIVATSISHGIIITNNTFEQGPITNGQTINLDSTSSEIWGVVITDNAFVEVFVGSGLTDTCYIRLTGDAADNIFGITVAHNTFGSNTAQAQTLEDADGFSVIADYLERSTIGPNTLVGKVAYKITNGTANYILPASADSEGPDNSGSITLFKDRKFEPDAARGADVAVGDQQGQIHHSGNTIETVYGAYVDAGVAPTVADMIIEIEYGDTDDLDTVAAWVVIDTVTLPAGTKSIKDVAPAVATIPANRLLRFNITQIGSGAAGQDVSCIMKTY